MKNKMTAIANSQNATPYGMTLHEIAMFVDGHSSDILMRLCRKGSCSLAEDAISELKCKILGAPIATGAELGFEKGQLGQKRTDRQWVAFLAACARDRQTKLSTKSADFYDRDAIDAMTRHGWDDVDGDMSVIDRMLVECETSCACYEAVRNVEGSGCEDDAGGQPEGNEGASCAQGVLRDGLDVVHKRLSRKQKSEVAKRKRVMEYLGMVDDARAGNHFPRPGASYDGKIDGLAARAVLGDLHLHHDVSRRDIEVYTACAMYRRDISEVAEEFGITYNHACQIVHKVNAALKKFGPQAFRRIRRRLFLEAA